MGRREGFARTLGFGLLAACVLPAGLALGAPLLGAGAVLRAIAAGLAVAYVAALGRGAARGRAATILAGVLAALLLLLPLGSVAVMVGAAALVAACRSGLLQRDLSLRALAGEALLAGAGLGLASLLAGGSALSLALAVWSYFLVQSVFFLRADAAAGRADPCIDPFERARSRLLEVLGEDDPGGGAGEAG